MAVSLALCACGDDPTKATVDPPTTTPTADTGSTSDSTTDTTSDTTDTATTTVTTGGCVDAYVGNDDHGRAVVGPLGELLAVSVHEPDYWQFEVASGQRRVVTPELQGGVGNEAIELSLVDEDGGLSQSSIWGIDLHNSSPDPITYTVVASALAAPTTCLSYTLTEEVLEAPLCVDGVGDTWQDATPLVREGTRMTGEDTLHNGDEDWFVAEALEELTGRLVLDTAWVESGVILEIYDDPTAPPLLATDGRYSYEYFLLDIDWTALKPFPPGLYYVRVVAPGSGPVCDGPYELYWTR